MWATRDLFRGSRLATDLLASEGRRQAILQAMPDLMFVQSADGVYLDFHAPRPDQLFAPPDEFLGKRMADVLPAAAIAVLQPAFEQAATGFEPVIVEYELALAQGSRRYEARLIRTDASDILTLVRDVTDARRTVDALRDSQQRYALAGAAGAVGVWDWNFELNQLFIDPGLKALLGYDDAEISTAPEDWGSRVHPDDLDAATAAIQACIDGVTASYEIEHRMLHKDGSVRWMLSRGSPMRAADGRVTRLVGTKVDITGRKQAEEMVRENQAVLEASHREVRDLATRLIAAQDAERARIARELHDDLSQQLAGLSIELSGLKRRLVTLPGAGELSTEVSSLQQRTVAIAENIRHLSHDLHPTVLHAGLVPALAAHCEQIQHHKGIMVSFSAEGDFATLSPAVSLCLYRVAQEGLRNVVTHAQAPRAALRLARVGDQVELIIADEGRGIATEQDRARANGLGLVSIYERVKLAGGSVSMVTERNSGTRVRVQLPAVNG